MEWKECMIFLCEAYRNEVPHHRRCNIASPHRCLFLCCSQCSLRSRTYRIHKCGSKAASSYIQKFICVDKKKNNYEATAVLCNLHHCTICTNGRFSIAFIIRYTWIRYTMKQITMLYTQYSSHSYSHVNWYSCYPVPTESTAVRCNRRHATHTLYGLQTQKKIEKMLYRHAIYILSKRNR